MVGGGRYADWLMVAAGYPVVEFVIPVTALPTMALIVDGGGGPPVWFLGGGGRYAWLVGGGGRTTVDAATGGAAALPSRVAGGAKEEEPSLFEVAMLFPGETYAGRFVDGFGGGA